MLDMNGLRNKCFITCLPFQIPSDCFITCLPFQIPSDSALAYFISYSQNISLDEQNLSLIKQSFTNKFQVAYEFKHNAFA